MGNKLYVGNLDFQTTSQDLTELFMAAGQVLSAQVIADRDTRRSKGFAFVEMQDSAGALKAISLFNGSLFHERTLQVSEARSRDDQGSRGNYGRGTSANARPKFREVRHKARGGRKARPF